MSVIGYYRRGVILQRLIMLNELNKQGLCALKYGVLIAVGFSLLVNTAAHGYATNFDYATSAKWSNNLNFMICLSNNQGKEYEALFIKAVEEWKSRWPHFGYRISYASGCHINLFILETHSMLSEHGYVGYTNIEHWQHGAITKADIILPTHKKVTVTTEVKGKTFEKEYLEPLSKVQFYRAALHEFGHALNLGHFDDNGIEPIDIMYPYPADDEQEQGISQRDIQALNWYYLGFFGQEMKVRTLKTHYEAGDTVSILGNVDKVRSGKSVQIEVSSGKKLFMSDIVNVNPSGAFTYKMKIPNDIESGSYKVKASYDGLIVDASFEIKNNNSDVSEKLITEETNRNLPFRTDKKVSVLDTKIVDHSGSEVTSIKPQEQVFIHSSLSSGLAEQTEATYIIQIKNSKGYTEQISSVNYNLVSGISKLSLSWLPIEPEKYEIQIFLWKSMLDPEPLMPTKIDFKVSVA
ncbi:MAG: matrixin family metalloprotease [Nitrososphaerales archaeon]